MTVLHIGVIGPSAADERTCELARLTGALLAAAEVTVVVGGVDGVSAAAAIGAAGQGGTVISLLPGYARSTVDLPATVTVPTGLGELSNGLLVRASDALLSIGGGWGTFIEIALALRTQVPVISLDGWGILDTYGRPVEGPLTATTPEDAVLLAREAARRRSADDADRIG